MAGVFPAVDGLGAISGGEFRPGPLRPDRIIMDTASAQSQAASDAGFGRVVRSGTPWPGSRSTK